MPALSFMTKPAPSHGDDAYLHDMLAAARLIQRYLKGVRFEAFWRDDEKRDAVAMRLSVIGEAAAHVSPATQKALPTIPFKVIRGLRNRIAHDYGAIDFTIVWKVTQNDLKPLVIALEAYFATKSPRP